jgi:hypothetical protein
MNQPFGTTSIPSGTRALSRSLDARADASPSIRKLRSRNVRHYSTARCASTPLASNASSASGGMLSTSLSTSRVCCAPPRSPPPPPCSLNATLCRGHRTQLPPNTHTRTHLSKQRRRVSHVLRILQHTEVIGGGGGDGGGGGGGGATRERAAAPCLGHLDREAHLTQRGACEPLRTSSPRPHQLDGPRRRMIDSLHHLSVLRLRVVRERVSAWVQRGARSAHLLALKSLRYGVDARRGDARRLPVQLQPLLRPAGAGVLTSTHARAPCA